MTKQNDLPQSLIAVRTKLKARLIKLSDRNFELVFEGVQFMESLIPSLSFHTGSDTEFHLRYEGANLVFAPHDIEGALAFVDFSFLSSDSPPPGEPSLVVRERIIGEEGEFYSSMPVLLEGNPNERGEAQFIQYFSFQTTNLSEAQMKEEIDLVVSHPGRGEPSDVHRTFEKSLREWLAACREKEDLRKASRRFSTCGGNDRLNQKSRAKFRDLPCHSAVDKIGLSGLKTDRRKIVFVLGSPGAQPENPLITGVFRPYRQVCIDFPCESEYIPPYLLATKDVRQGMSFSPALRNHQVLVG